MPDAKEIVVALAIAIAVGNIAVSVALVRCHFYSVAQKLAQTAIIWCVPLFGAVGVWAFLRAQYNWEKFDTRHFPKGTEKGRGIAVQNAVHESFGGEGGGTASD